jgi:hypothetical protein
MKGEADMVHGKEASPTALDLEDRVADAVGRVTLARFRGLWAEARMALAAADRALELLEKMEREGRPQ